MTTIVEKSVEINAPVAIVYALYADFENFPAFMKDVDSVVRKSTDVFHWKASIFGVEREWDAQVVDLIANTRIAWKALDDSNSGAVDFYSLEDNSDSTRVMLQLKHDPEGLLEHLGDTLGIISDQAEGDLQRFKEYCESVSLDAQSKDSSTLATNKDLDSKAQSLSSTTRPSPVF